MLLETLEDRSLMAVISAFEDWASDVAVGPTGDIFVRGGIKGTVDFDPGPGQTLLQGNDPSANYSALNPYLARYTPAGQLVWAVKATDVADAATDIGMATYSDGSGTSNYLSYYLPNTNRDVLAKFNDAGTRLWEKDLPVIDNTWLTADPAGGLYVAGTFNGTIDFDPVGSLPGDTLTSDGRDIYIFKWDGDGNFQWVRQIGGPSDVWGNMDIAADANGVAIAGGLQGTLVPPGSSEAYPDQGTPGDGFIIRLDANGNYQPNSAGRLVNAYATQVVLDGGNMYVTGGFQSGNDLDPGTGTLNFAGNGNFLLKISSPTSSPTPAAGGWAQSIYGATFTVSGGDVYLTAGFEGTVDFDPSPTQQFNLTSLGSSDIVVMKLAGGDGSFAWAKRLGGDAEDYGMSLAVGGDAVYSTGLFCSRAADFDPGAGTAYFNADGDRDGFVSKLTTGGDYQFALQIGNQTRTIDNGDADSLTDGDALADYREIGSGWKNYNSSGYQRDARSHMKGTGTNKVQWIFSGLTPGELFDVRGTWVADFKNATNAVFKANGVAAAAVNQRLTPDDFQNDHINAYGTSTRWKQIGRYAADANGVLLIELSDAANGTVVADAIKIVAAAPPSSPASMSLDPASVDFLMSGDTTKR